MWNIELIKPYANNPRANDHAVDAVDAVVASIREFGFRQPIVVDRHGVIIVGHTRWKAALKLGLKKVPVHVATDLSPKQIKAYRLADNKTAELADWDHDKLVQELVELEKLGFDFEPVGFTADELQDLLGTAPVAGRTDPDPNRPTRRLRSQETSVCWASIACCAATRATPPMWAGCSTAYPYTWSTRTRRTT